MITKIKRKLAKYPYGGDFQERRTDTKDATGNTIMGAATGAASGAVAGSQILPGYGTAVGAVLGGLYGGYTSYSEADEYNKQLKEDNKKIDTSNKIFANTQAQNQNTFRGNPNVNVYAAFGGNIKAQSGGKLVPINSDTSKAVGATHEQGGIDISARNGINAEVENQEVVQGSRVFSDRLHTGDGITFAQKSEALSKDKAKNEALLKSTDSITKGTAQRRISAVNTKLDNLYVLQDQTRKALGLENEPGQAKYGNVHPNYDDLGRDIDAANATQVTKGINAAGLLVPYLDNLYNAKLIGDTPEVPNPRLNQATNLVTEYNANPQLAAIDRETTATNQGINRSVNSGSVSSAFRSANLANAIQAKSDILGNKVNIETGLINADRLNKQGVQFGNNALLNSTDLLKTQRLADINSMKSANAANAVDDFKAQTKDVANSNLDAQKIKEIENQYATTGIIPEGFENNPNWITAIANIDGVTEDVVRQRYANKNQNRGGNKPIIK